MGSGKKTRRLPGIRTFEMVQYISGWPASFPDTGEGTMDDLPANLQDVIYKAMERKSLEVALPLAVVKVRCDVDLDKPEDAPDRVFLHVILSEVVAADIRATRH